MINLKKIYIIAPILITIISIVYLILFPRLFIFFLIPSIIGVINYFLLERIQRYEKLSHLNVLGTIFLRYIVYAVVIFLMIWLNKDSEEIIFMGISIAIGFSMIQVSTIINTFFKRDGVSKR